MARVPRMLCSLLVVFCSSLNAQTLTTFVDGQPALASQVNGNFSALLAEVQSLKAQVAALQPKTGNAAIAGTWDLFSITNGSFGVIGTSMYAGSSGSSGTVVIDANGTLTISQTGILNVLDIGNIVHLPCQGCLTSSRVTPNAHSGPDPELVNGSASYTISGNILTISAGGESLQLKMAASRDLMFLYGGDEGGITLAILSKR